MSEDKVTFEVTTPMGRLINFSLFERDQYDKEAKLKYNIELAFDPDQVYGEGTEEEPSVEDVLYAAAEHYWGEGAGQRFLDGDIRSPLLIGDNMKAKRDAKGKPGDAYEGKIVIRAGTIFNKDGFAGPGGIDVWDEELKAIAAVAQAKVYRGSYGAASLVVDNYTDTDPRTDEEILCLMFYLKAYQFLEDGERLVLMADTAGAFKAVGRAKTGRSKRAG